VVHLLYRQRLTSFSVFLLVCQKCLIVNNL
jgi:hypothetical protein